MILKIAWFMAGFMSVAGVIGFAFSFIWGFEWLMWVSLPVGIIGFYLVKELP
jgi:hypothetical protein